MKSMRVLLVDDHALVRAGLRALVERITDCEVVGEAGNGREALDQVETQRPIIVLMDILMPEMNGLDAAAQIVAQYPAVRVIILSMNADEEYVSQALHAGASGYLLKNVSPGELELALRAVLRGEIYLSSAISKQVVNGFVRGATGRAPVRTELTPRQREVLQLIAEGHTTKEIARRLSISVKTAETHRTQLMDALDIHDVAGLVRYAIRTGIITADK